MDAQKEDVVPDEDDSFVWPPTKPSDLIGLFLTLIAVLVVVGCFVLGVVSVFKAADSITTPEAPVVNTDPRAGWTEILDGEGEGTGIWKVCDGTTLIREDGGLFNRMIASEENSDECK